jgi:hypothetical protein
MAVLAAGASLAAVAAQSAVAAPHTISITAPASLAAGQPAIVRVGGVVAPPEEFWDLAFIEVVAISTSVVPECPASDGDAGLIAENTGGQILAIALRPYADAAGNYSNSVGYTARAPGRVFVCAYLDDGEGLTLARAGVTVDVGGGSGSGGGAGAGGSRPVNVLRPRVTRAGRTLVCHPGHWDNAGSYSYSWLFDGRRSRATGREVSLRGDVRGHSAACRVKARGSGGTATATSRPFRLR